MKTKKYCKHNWQQIGKRFEINEAGFIIKILIDSCSKCGKVKER